MWFESAWILTLVLKSHPLQPHVGLCPKDLTFASRWFR